MTNTLPRTGCVFAKHQPHTRCCVGLKKDADVDQSWVMPSALPLPKPGSTIGDPTHEVKAQGLWQRPAVVHQNLFPFFHGTDATQASWAAGMATQSSCQRFTSRHSKSGMKTPGRPPPHSFPASWVAQFQPCRQLGALSVGRVMTWTEPSS